LACIGEASATASSSAGFGSLEHNSSFEHDVPWPTDQMARSSRARTASSEGAIFALSSGRASSQSELGASTAEHGGESTTASAEPAVPNAADLSKDEVEELQRADNTIARKRRSRVFSMMLRI